MNKEEIKQYLKDNLKIKWKNYDDDSLYIVLILENDIISKIKYAQ